MALIPCPECKTEVSSTAYKCTSCGYTIRRPRRGFFGKLFKWTFIAFNVLMAWWLFAYWGGVGDRVGTGTSAEQVGTAIGATIGSGMLITLWALGDVILGMLVLFTRPRA